MGWGCAVTSPGDPILVGLRAWLDGDLDELEEVLDPDVTLVWTGPGGMDRVGRQQVMATLGGGGGGAGVGAPSPGTRRVSSASAGTSSLFPSRARQWWPAVHRPGHRWARVIARAGRVIRWQQFSSWDAAVRVSDPVVDAAVAAVHAGDVPGLQQLLSDHPSLASARLLDHGRRTLLHVATDWPGHFPNVRGTLTALVVGGADIDAPSIGDHAETPLHWAASSGASTPWMRSWTRARTSRPAVRSSVAVPHCPTRPRSASGTPPVA